MHAGPNVGFSFTVAAFVKSDKVNQFPNFEVKYVRGADPVVKLYK